MQNKNYKKIVVFAMCLTMLMPLGSMAVSSASKTTTSTTSSSSKDKDKDSTKSTSSTDTKEEEAKRITDKEALAKCKLVKENDKLGLYFDKDNKRVCLYDKGADKCWWSSPINAASDKTAITDDPDDPTMKDAQRSMTAAAAAIKVGDLRQEKRTESPAPLYSNNAMDNWVTSDNGIAVTYNYSLQGVQLTMHFELQDDNLYVYCDTKDIKEANTTQLDGKVLTKLTLCPFFGASEAQDGDGNATSGYMIVPDGSGAVINYNNGKSAFADYAQQVYGRDYTAVPLNAPRVTEQAYMPVLATASGSTGLVCVASDGDANVYAHATVPGQDNFAYNNVYFEFETRSSDSFFMSGDNSNKISVFEKNGIKTSRFGVRYYPVSKEDKSDVNYADCAETYRNYLIKNKGLTQKTTANTNNLYLDLYGGVKKQTSIAGIPFNLKTEVTGFSQAKTLIDSLKKDGVSSMTVNYNDWTNDSINGKISTDYSPSGTLGGSSDFDSLVNADKKITIVPSMNNFTMSSSSFGYMTFTSTAIRISNAYSRQSKYNPAFGVAEDGVSPALLTPNKYSNVFSDMLSSYADKNATSIGFGDFATKLVSDYSKKEPSSRSKTLTAVVNGYKDAAKKMSTVYASGANSYVLPYVTNISNVPVYSSKFDVTDIDIPFYQMVVHGYIPYSSTAINKSSSSNDTFMLSLAAGSQIHYDMTYADADVLQDTDYNNLYYTNYKGWSSLAAKQYKAANQILASVSDYTITDYTVNTGSTVYTTTYSKKGKENVVIKVDKNSKTATVNDKVYDLSDCIEGGLSN